jgi:hypothetical protein
MSRFILKLWPFILIATLALSAVSLPRTIRLFQNISTDPVDLLPSKNPNVQSLMKVRDKLEKGGRVSFVFESDSPIRTVSFLKDTVEKLRREPSVGKVIDRKIGYDFFNRHKLIFVDLRDLEKIRDEIDRRIQKEKLGSLLFNFDDSNKEPSFDEMKQKNSGRYDDEMQNEYNVSRDGRIYSIFVESKEGSNSLAEASRFQDAMEAFVKTLEPYRFDPTMQVYFSGASKVLEYRALMRDLKKVGLIAVFLLFIPLLFRFRNPLYLTLLFLPLALAMPMSFALSSFFIPKLNVSTSFLFAILGGLGIENGIHIFSRYYEVRLEGKDQRSAIEDIYEHTGRAILTSVASVAITFLLLMINDFRGFSDFGLISGVGLWVIFGVYFTFLPALLVFLEKTKILKFKLQAQKESKPLNVKAVWLKIALVLFVLFSVYSVAAIPFLKFEFDSKKIRADIPEVRVAKQKQRLTARRVNNPAAVVINGPQEAELLKQKVAALKTNEDSTVDGSRSYYDLIPADQEARMAVIAQIRTLLDDPVISLVKGKNRFDLNRFRKALEESSPVREEEIPPDLKEIFKGKSNVAGELFYINALPQLELDDGRNAMKFADEVQTIQTPETVYHPSSDGVVYGIVLKTMLRDAKKVLLISLLSVAFFVMLDFRDWKKAGIVLLSIIVGVFWLLGLMLIFGIKFNFYNMIIIPAVMGMSIDNSIHIYHRYEELGRGSLTKVLSSTGVAALLASLTNASGFFGLLFCLHRGLYSIGLLAVIGVATCLVSTLVFLPALLQFLEIDFKKRSL